MIKMGILPDIKNIEISDKVMDDIDISIVNEMLDKITKGELQIVKCNKYFKGNGQKYFGESLDFEVLYTCKVCMHQMKDKEVCGLDGLQHEHICHMLNKI